jgi:hypothetical protein
LVIPSKKAGSINDAGAPTHFIGLHGLTSFFEELTGQSM